MPRGSYERKVFTRFFFPFSFFNDVRAIPALEISRREDSLENRDGENRVDSGKMANSFFKMQKNILLFLLFFNSTWRITLLKFEVRNIIEKIKEKIFSGNFILSKYYNKSIGHLFPVF